LDPRIRKLRKFLRILIRVKLQTKSLLKNSINVMQIFSFDLLQKIDRFSLEGNSQIAYRRQQRQRVMTIWFLRSDAERGSETFLQSFFNIESRGLTWEMKSINHGAHQASRGLNFAKLSPQIFAACLGRCRLHLLKISLMSFAMPYFNFIMRKSLRRNEISNNTMLYKEFRTSSSNFTKSTYIILLNNNFLKLSNNMCNVDNIFSNEFFL